MLCTLLFLPACTQGGVCPDEAPPPVAACIAPVGGWAESPGSVEEVTASFVGDVVESAAGSPPESHCFQEMHPGDRRPPSELDVVWARVDSGGQEWIVALSTPGIDEGLLPEVGGELSVDYRFRFGGFGPDAGHLTLWDRDGALLAWVAQAGDVAGLTTPTEVSVVRGAEVCQESDECGAWSRYELRMNVAEQSGVAVDYGAQVEVGDFTVVHGGYEASTETTSSCMDWYVGDLRTAVVRR